MSQQLFNHLWQSTVFGATAAALAFALRRNRASVRFWIWTAASFKFLVPFALLVGIGARAPVTVAPTAAPVKIAAAIEWAADPIFIPTPHTTHTPPTILLAVWAAGL